MRTKIALWLLTFAFCALAATMPSRSSEPEIRDHRTQEQVRDHRATRKNEVVPIDHEKLDCSVGAEKLRRMGYTSVVSANCNGPVYHYTAIDKASLFRVMMSAYTGKLRVNFIGVAK